MYVFALMLATLGRDDFATTLADSVLLGFNCIVVEGIVLARELLLLDHEFRIYFADSWCLTLMRALVRLITHAPVASRVFRMKMILHGAHESTIGKSALVRANDDMALTQITH